MSSRAAQLMLRRRFSCRFHVVTISTLLIVVSRRKPTTLGGVCSAQFPRRYSSHEGDHSMLREYRLSPAFLRARAAGRHALALLGRVWHFYPCHLISEQTEVVSARKKSTSSMNDDGMLRILRSILRVEHKHRQHTHTALSSPLMLHHPKHTLSPLLNRQPHADAIENRNWTLTGL